VKILRAGLHGLVLVIADLAGVGGGAIAAFQVWGVPNQVWLQLPIAVGLSIILFSTWMLVLGASGFRRLQFLEAKEAGVCLVLSVVWAPAIFVPLHYVTQEYLTSIGNLIALALYVLPVNALALAASSVLQRAVWRKCSIPSPPR
jgi:hypothetical protein